MQISNGFMIKESASDQVEANDFSSSSTCENAMLDPMLQPQDIGIRFPSWATQNRMLRHGVLKYAREFDLPWRIMEKFAANYELPEVEIDKDWEGAGMIVFRCTEEEAESWQNRNIPIVNVSSECEIKGVPSVIADDYQIGRIAAKHMFDIGMPHVAFVGNATRIYA